ncbi:MAG: DUF177 domain-containing protein [Clostridia bacterium]|nr:DUF177 domain-containing protein [Clostridia bacterium]
MILDLKKLKRSGKDSSGFFFEYSPQTELLDLPQAKIVLPIKINGTVTLTGEHSAYIEAEVAFAVAGECTRCLKDTTKEFTLDFSEAVEENNVDGYSVKNDTVDLTKMVDDIITINSPTNFLCDENCKGICLGCGVNLNDGECKCNINK